MWTNRRQGPKSRDELVRMRTEELEEILRLDSYGEGGYSTEDILYILELLENREREQGQPCADVDRAWQAFQKDYLPQHKDKKSWWTGLHRGMGATAAALALVVVGLLTAQAAGWDVLGSFGKWNDEIFTFGSLETEIPTDGGPVESIPVSQEPSQQPEIISYEIVEYDTLQEALDAGGITEVKAPRWLPEGCQFTGATQLKDLNGDVHQISASFQQQGDVLALDIFKSRTFLADVEKMKGLVEITDLHGQTVYLIHNNHDYTVAWQVDGYECYLSGLDPQALENMAASMLQ